MTSAQRIRRGELEARLGRPDGKSVEVEMGNLLLDMLDRVSGGRRLEIHSDEHPAYKRAIRKLSRELGDVIVHKTVSSRAARTSSNRLFVINATDAFLRHSQSNHRRETISASKRRQMGLERLSLFVVWRNLVKRRFENGAVESSAMRGGWSDRLWSWGDVFRDRLFRNHIVLPRRWNEIYCRRVKTSAYGSRQVEHSCNYAF